jgi:hypothetical protein
MHFVKGNLVSCFIPNKDDHSDGYGYMKQGYKVGS